MAQSWAMKGIKSLGNCNSGLILFDKPLIIKLRERERERERNCGRERGRETS